jgi:hypothetical protein
MTDNGMLAIMCDSCDDMFASQSMSNSGALKDADLWETGLAAVCIPQPEFCASPLSLRWLKAFYSQGHSQ